MTEHIDELERLAELRRRGTLTAEEYQREKGKLLDGQGAVGGGYWQRNRTWLTGASGAVGLALAVFVIKPMMTAKSEPDAVISTPTDSARAGEGDGWSTNDQSDAMTDATIKTVTRTFDGSAANIEMAISCSSKGIFRYQASSFGKDGEAVAMQSQVTSNLTPYIPFDVRLDRAEPGTITNQNPRYSNQVSLEVQEIPGSISPGVTLWDPDTGIADVALRAKKVTFQFHLEHSDETVAIDQTSPNVASVIEQCTSLRRDQLAKAKEQGRLDAVAEERRQANEPHTTTVTNAM